jgi:hypothetical protein
LGAALGAVALVAVVVVAGPGPVQAHDWNGGGDDDVVIDNTNVGGTVRLGIHPQGHLNVCVDETCPTGLQYVPNGNESTAPGCYCEGWGAGSADLGYSGYANEATDGVVNLEVESFDTSPSTARSVVLIGDQGAAASTAVSSGNPQDRPPIEPGPSADAISGQPGLRVTHDYHPSSSPNLYEATVTIENVSDDQISDVRYRRVMDWDIEPTAFAEYVTIQGSAEDLLFSSDDGFQTANPLGARSSIRAVGPPTGAAFEDNGPADHGALFDFGLGGLDPGESRSFNIYYGAAGNEDDALTAVATVGAEVYSLGQSSTADGPTLGTPNTFIFGFTGFGGAGEVGRDARPPVRLIVHQDPAALNAADTASTCEVGASCIPFDITADLKNIGTGDATGVVADLVLGAGLHRVSGADPAAVGTLAPGAEAHPGWHVEATQACEDVVTSYDVNVDYAERPADEAMRTVHRVVTIPGTCGALTGRVDTATFGPTSGAEVQLCPASAGAAATVASGCQAVTTDSSGRFRFSGLGSGEYEIEARPPSPEPGGYPAGVLPTTVRSLDVSPTTTPDLVVVLTNFDPIPTDMALTPSRDYGLGVPVVYYGESVTLTKTDQCTGGRAWYEVRQGPDADADGFPDSMIQGAGMAEGPPGTYSAVIPPFFPHHDYAQISAFVDCPPIATGGRPFPQAADGDAIQSFDIYIDPSGFVKDTAGVPIAGATVTLFRSDSSSGPFVVVPNGSTVMSAANRTNPDVTDAGGHFGWDVKSGFYKVRAEKAGCQSPTAPGTAYVETAVLEVPPAWTDLDLRLDCGGGPPPPPPPAGGTCDGKASTVAPTSFDAGTGVTTFQGTNGDDVIVGTGGPDIINGLGGNDTICGRGGDDTITGGKGMDVVYGEAGGDSIRGGKHNDELIGGAGDDAIWGEDGADRILGGDGNDDLRGGNGRDFVNGGAGDDRIQGGGADDKATAHAGDDELIGGTGDDLLIGGTGNDRLDGGAGTDRCKPGTGADVLTSC